MATKVLVDTDSTQTLTNKTLTAPTITAGVIALAAAPSSTLDAATKGYVDGLNINPLNNGSLAASVSGNALTLSLKTAGGAVPSSTDPVRVTFRNSTDTDGSLVTRTVTGATTMTFASGSTLGTTSGQAEVIWVGLIDNAGTVELCAWNPYKTASMNALKGFTPNTDVTTTAEGSGTATSAHVLYSTNARSTVPFILLGYIEITEASAGVWASAPTAVQTYRDGMRKTGDLVGYVPFRQTAVATGTTQIPFDDTIPQNTEGDEYLSVAVVPTRAVNHLDIEILAIAGHSAAGGMLAIALFQDSTASAVAVTAQGFDAANKFMTLSLWHGMVAGTVSSTTFKARIGANTAGTTTLNGLGAGRYWGGTAGSRIVVREYYR